MISGVSAAAAGTGGQTNIPGTVPPPPDLVSKDAFLQLLVAQIRYQDPLNPTDGAEFVAELAQFSSLEQLMGIREGIDALNGMLTTPPEAEGGQEP